jgi:hypothetical protein
MSIIFEGYNFYNNGGDGVLKSLETDGGDGGGGAGGGPVTGFFDQQLTGIPASIPEAVIQAAKASANTIVITTQVLAEGFGSYLTDILPRDIAVTAGAFGASMQQIKNITQIPVEKFAQVVASMETIQGLDLVNGTNVPTDVSQAQVAYELVALGTGPYKTFTYSDFYGCMSGLPYDWKSLQTAIFDLQTSTLTDTYKQLYLAVSWKQATVSVQYTTNLNLPDGPTTYTVTGVTLSDAGGGYGREGASAPSITISNGGSGTTTIGTDDSNMLTFGKVISVALSSAGPDDTTIPTATVDYPPGGSIYPNNVIQDYIDAANDEIALIRTVKPGVSMDLNDIYDNFGAQLINEQRARNKGLSPVANPRDPYSNKYSITEYAFVDSIPLYGKQTQPNMAAQTLEAISDLTFVAGQCVIAQMRKARNQDRLNFVGIPLDDNIPDFVEEQKEWIANTIVNTVTGLVGNAVPAYPNNTDPLGYYDPVTQTYNVQAQPVDTGGPKVPGSLAKSPYQNLIPPELNTLFTSDVLLPAQYNVIDAIEQVITCNCDCWI